MQNDFLEIEGTKTMPAISFKEGKLDIIGRSIPIDSCEWFAPLLNVMYAYKAKKGEKLEINIQLDFLNSESNRTLLNLLTIAEKIYNEGHAVHVKWYYKPNDPVMFEQGNIFQSLVELPFTFEPIV
ncbi:MAG TPA: DUF1987 domain-containing protein [Bacteroidales bacterium]|nr:DUF1987 domain-containing protein [Bacteroidales bacterium]